MSRHYQAKHSGKPRREKKYFCEICEKTFYQQYELKEHVKVKHEGVRYNCEHCARIFMQLSGLKHHLITSHPEQNQEEMKRRIFMCEVCSRTFRSEPMLHYHKKRHHQVKKRVRGGTGKALAPRNFII